MKEDSLNITPLSFFRIGVLLLIACTSWGQSQPFFTSGTEFSFPYLGSSGGFGWYTDQQRIVQVTAANATCGSIEIPSKGYRLDFSIEKDSSLLVQLPRFILQANKVHEARIKVKSKYPVQVVQVTDVGLLDSLKGMHAWPKDCVVTEASAICPVSLAQSNYMVNGPNFRWGSKRDRAMHFWAYILEDSTKLGIRLNTTSWGSLPVDTFFYRDLDEGDVYYLFSNLSMPPAPLDWGRSFSGSDVIGLNEPIMLFAGTPSWVWGWFCISNVSDFGGGQETFEQVKPDNVGDTLFMAAQIQDNYPNLYSIMPLEDSTAIYINGQLLDIRDRSYQVDTCWAGDAVITANKPVQVMLTRSAPGIIDTNSPNSSLLSPFTINLAGSNELIKRSVLKPFGGDYGMTYVVALFTPTASTAAFTVNGQPLAAGSWQPYATRPGWSHAQIEISDKTHILESTGEGFVGYHYSYMKKTPNYYYMPSYGYCLIESKPVPQDSLSFYIKREEGEKEKFEDFDKPVCVGEQLMVYPPAAHHVSWQWSFDDGRDTIQVIEGQQGDGFLHSYAIPGTYWIFVNDTAGCSPPDSVKVEVVEPPVADFDYTSQMTCDGLEVQFYNKTLGATKYNWQLANGESSEEESPVFVLENSEEEFTATLRVENAAGCVDEVSKTVKPQTQDLNDLKVPNVFTPNGDGVNDCFYVPNKEGYAACFELSIYNRWGVKVFHTTNPLDCWAGEEHSAGTYFYVLKVGKTEFKGHLLLNR